MQALAWFGAAVLYYVLFSLLFDTPAEYELRHSTDRLKREYATLVEQYDSLEVVLDNVVERDRNIFAISTRSTTRSVWSYTNHSWQKATARCPRRSNSR